MGEREREMGKGVTESERHREVRSRQRKLGGESEKRLPKPTVHIMLRDNLFALAWTTNEGET